MNRKRLIAIGAIATVGKIIIAVVLTVVLARCSGDKPVQNRFQTDNFQPSEFDYSLGKSATHSNSTSNTAPQSHNYGRNRK